MESEEELNLNFSNILNTSLLILNKNKKLFSLLLILNLLFSTIYIFSRKDLWIGKSIVTLNFDNEKNFLNKEGNIPKPSQSMGKLNSLIRSRFEILQSKSVLKPVFDLYRDTLSKQNKNKKIDDFETWKNNLQFNLKRGTNLLELKYVSYDKETISPIIKKSLEIINNYPVNKKLKDAREVLNKLNKSVPILEKISLKSAKDLDNFLIQKNMDTYPELMREYNFEKKLVFIENENKLTKSDSINKNVLPISEKRNSSKLKNFNSIDLVKFRTLEAKFEMANERYINSLANKNNMESLIDNLPIVQNFQDSIQIERIGNSKKNFLLKSFSLSFLIIFFICLFIELKKGIILFSNSYAYLIKEKPLINLSDTNKENWEMFLNLIFDKRLPKDNLTIFCLGAFPKDFIDFLNSSFPEISISTSENISELDDVREIIPIFYVGHTTKNQVLELKKLLNLKNIKKLNYLLFEDKYF